MSTTVTEARTQFERNDVLAELIDVCGDYDEARKWLVSRCKHHRTPELAGDDARDLVSATCALKLIYGPIEC